MAAEPLRAGDTVDIVGGPFSGGRARVLQVDEANRKVRVEMKVLGEPAPFTVEIDQVRVAAAPAGH